MTYKQFFHLHRQTFSGKYGSREAAGILDMILEKITGWSRSQRLIRQDEIIPDEQFRKLEQHIEKLTAGMPVQYILEEAWFCNLPFTVTPAVLIPRPETEELVEWVLKEIPANQVMKLLDVGTGSGCIAISLKKAAPLWIVSALDMSEEALKITALNARNHEADISVIHTDFRDSEQWRLLPKQHVLVSNPPYIPLKEQDEMEDHVVKQEPHTALFVPDHDILLFYRLLAQAGRQLLYPGGQIFVEIHVNGGIATKVLFEEHGYINVELRKDMHGNDRMIRAGWPSP